MKEHKHSEIIGPFLEPEWSYATVDGYKVPLIKIVQGKGENDGKIEFHLDGRFVYIFDDAGDIDVLLPLLANAMAIAAGYSCFGKNSIKDPNPFKIQMRGLS
jgi:hypothetical protein